MAPSFKVTLSEHQIAELRARAHRLGLTPQELAQASLADLLEHQDDAFERIVARVLEKNKELYERLS